MDLIQKILRSRESTKLLTYGLTNFDLVDISKAKEPFDKVDVWLGKKDKIDVYVKSRCIQNYKKS